MTERLEAHPHHMHADLIVVTVKAQEDGTSVVARFNRQHADSLRLTSLAKRLGITKRQVREVLDR